MQNPSSSSYSPPELNLSASLECVAAYGIYEVDTGVCLHDRVLYRLSSHQELEEAIYGRIFPILVLFVVAANVLVAMVLSKKHMVTPTNVVLKYMAIADLFVGLTPLPWTMYYFTFGNNRQEENITVLWCYIQKFSMDALPPVFHNVAMWLTVLLAGQRFISISYPLYSRSLCNVRNVRLCTVAIGVISILCGLPKSFDYNLELYSGYVVQARNSSASYVRSCMMSPTNIVTSVGENLYFSVYFWTRSLVFVVLPSVLLIGLNAGLIRGIRKAQKRKERLLKEKRTRDAQRATDTNATSLMLVVIVTIFLVVNLPQAFFMVVMCIVQTFPNIRLGFILDGSFPLVFLLVNNMLVMATYPINFAIYCFMSSSFRQTFRALFLSNPIFGVRSEAESSLINERRMENSAVPLVRFLPDEATVTDENGCSKNRRNDSVFL